MPITSRRYLGGSGRRVRRRNGSNLRSSQTRGGSSGPVPATPPSSAHGPASPSQGSPSQPVTGPRDSGSSPPVSGSPWCPASPPRRCRAPCAGSRSTTTPAGSGGPSGRRQMTIRAQPRPPWSTPWRRRSVPRRAVRSSHGEDCDAANRECRTGNRCARIPTAHTVAIPLVIGRAPRILATVRTLIGITGSPQANAAPVV